MSVSRAEQQAAWREDHMRQELADMQQVKSRGVCGGRRLASSSSVVVPERMRKSEISVAMYIHMDFLSYLCMHVACELMQS